MKTKLYLLLVLLQISITAQVSVHLQQPPPYGFKLENLWKVTLINSSSESFKVYLSATATEQTAGEILEATSAPFFLHPGPKLVNTTELMPLDVKVINNKYSDVIKKLNMVPEGDYEICVSVINFETGAQLGIECIQTTVQNVSTIELLAPDDHEHILSSSEVIDQQSYNDENIKVVQGSYVNFNWLAPPQIYSYQHPSYSIRIAEIMGYQTAYDALQSNPLFYSQNNIQSTLFQFPLIAHPFNRGKKYAWQVTSYINGTPVSKSEAREFSFGKEEIPVSKKYYKNIDRLPSGLSEFSNFKRSELFYNNMPDNSADNFSFSGALKLEAYSSSVQSVNSEIPKSFTNLEIFPVLSVFGLPFSSNVLLSTMQQTGKQDISGFNLNFDLQAFRDNLEKRGKNEANQEAESVVAEKKKDLMNQLNLKKQLFDSEGKGSVTEIDSMQNALAQLQDELDAYQPENLQERLEKGNMISGMEKVLMNVGAFSIGTTYPNYTPYTLSGVPVSGVNIEITPAFLYMAFTGSMNQKGIENEAFRRNLFAGRFGIGRRENSHFHLTGLYAKDDAFSIQDNSTNQTLTPKANYVFGVEGKLAFFDNNLTFEGEAAGSMLTRDTRSADLVSNAIPSFAKNLLQPKINSSADYMYTAKTSFKIDQTNTKISMGLKMIGPGFTSLGVPNIQSDYFGYEGKLDQKLIDDHISFSASLKTKRDNLIDWKLYTTRTTSFNSNLGIRFHGFPVLNLSFSPNIQRNNSSDPAKKIDNSTNIMSIMSSYNYPLFEFQSSTSIIYSLQNTKTAAGISDFSTDNIMLTQTATLDMPMTLTGTFGVIHLKPAGLYSRITTFDLNAAFPILEIVQGIVGCKLAVEKDKEEKSGYYIGASVNISENLSFTLNAESLGYIGYATQTEYTDANVRAELKASW